MKITFKNEYQKQLEKRMNFTKKTIAIWMFVFYHLCMVYMAYSVGKDPASLFSHFQMMVKTCLNPTLISLHKA